MKRSNSWALVLSGGGARGLAHIGIIKGLEDAGFPKPSLVAGTSIGAIVGGLYACGMSPAELERFAVDEFEIADYLDSFVFRINGTVGKVIQTGQALASLAGRPGIDPGQRILELLLRLTKKKKFSDTVIPFRCNAVDLFNGREIVFSSGSVAKAMRASMSLPVLFEPFVHDGMCLVDGGLLDNMPVNIARKEGFKNVLAVNVNPFPNLTIEDLKNGPQIIFRSIECAIQGQEQNKPKANLTIEISVDTDVFSFLKQKELIALGEKAVKENIDALKKFFRKRRKQ